MLFCTACGNSLTEGARFCVACGRPAPPPAAPGPAPPAPPAAEPGTPRPAPPPAAPAPPVEEPSVRSHPAPPAAESGPPAGATAPGWRGNLGNPSAWVLPARLGLSALGLGLAAQYALGTVLVLIQWLTGAGVDWGATLRAPLTVFLSLHGPVENLGLWATGVGWVLMAFWWAGRHQRRSTDGSASWKSGLVLAAQTALVYTAPVVVLALFFDPEALPIVLRVDVAGVFVEPAAYGGWNPWLVVPLGLLVSLLGAGLAMNGFRVLAPLTARLPRTVTAGMAGARSLLSIALPAVLGVVVIGVFVKAMVAGTGMQLGLAYLLTLLLAAGAWGGLNVSVAFIVFSMRFFGGDGWVVQGERPAWLLVCVAIIALAYLWGGYRAARSLGPAPVGETVLAAGIAGVLVAVGLLIGALLGTGTAPGLAGPAFGLGLLWSALAVAGGLWQAGVRPGKVQRDGTGPAPPPTE